MRRDRLKSEKGADGEWHVAFTTAVRTLCGRVRAKQTRGRPGRPTCERCVTAAKLPAFLDVAGDVL